MAPDISKVNTDRHLNPGLSGWSFRDEVLRRVFHRNSLSPIRTTCSSHFSSSWRAWEQECILRGHPRQVNGPSTPPRQTARIEPRLHPIQRQIDDLKVIPLVDH